MQGVPMSDEDGPLMGGAVEDAFDQRDQLVTKLMKTSP